MPPVEIYVVLSLPSSHVCATIAAGDVKVVVSFEMARSSLICDKSNVYKLPQKVVLLWTVAIWKKFCQ